MVIGAKLLVGLQELPVSEMITIEGSVIGRAIFSTWSRIIMNLPEEIDQAGKNQVNNEYISDIS